MPSNIQKKFYSFLVPREDEKNWDKLLINTFIIVLIVLNTLAVIIETVDSIYIQYESVFKGFEFFSVIVFTIEYILRLWTCTCNEKYSHPVFGRLRYIFSFGALIDLIAILPFYLPFIFKADFRFIRILRLIRLFRFFKLGRYLNASKVITKVINDKKEQLVLSMGICVFLIIIASGLMYFIEHDAQPDKFSNIPETMWWSIATLTTSGYNNTFPVTALGKTLTSILSFLGIGLFALPAGILASGFSEAARKKKEKAYCPHCGKEID